MSFLFYFLFSWIFSLLQERTRSAGDQLERELLGGSTLDELNEDAERERLKLWLDRELRGATSDGLRQIKANIREAKKLTVNVNHVLMWFK